MDAFVIDPAIAGESVVLGDLPLCRALLMNDSRYPWIMLLPRLAGAEEIVDLAEEQRGQLMREIAIASAAIRDGFAPEKLNVGALGNKVRQMHVHVLGRFTSDPAWPGPVWGHSKAIPYPADGLKAAADLLRKAMRAAGMQEVGA